MEIAADPELLHLNLAGPAAFRGADERVVARMIEVADIGDVAAKLTGEILRGQRRVLRARVAVQPRVVSEREWIRFFSDGIRLAWTLRAGRRRREMKTHTEADRRQNS